MTALAIIVAASLLVVPGTALLSVLRCSVPFRLGLAPAASAGILGLLGLALTPLGIRWELPSVLIGVTVMTALAALIGRALVRQGIAGERPDHGPRGLVPVVLTLLGAAAAAAAVIVPAVRAGLGPETRINAFDAVFHYNAIAFVRSDGNATPWTALAGMYGGQRPYYPVSLHLLAALVPGTPIEAMNATLLVVVCATGLTTASLLWAVTPARIEPAWRGTVIALCLPMTALFFSIPVMVVPMGLWPNALAAVAFPAVAAATLHAIRVLDRIRRHEQWRDRAVRLLELLPEAVVIGGGVLIHPSIAFALGALALAAGTVHAVLIARSAPRRAAALGALLLIGVIVYDIAGMTVLRGMALTEKPWMGPISAVLALLSDRPRLTAVPLKSQYVIGVYALTVLGTVHAVRSRSRVRLTLVAFSVVALVLALGTVSSWVPLASLTNPWYQARERVLPMLTCTVIALAAIGGVRLIEAVRQRRPHAALPVLLALALSVAVPVVATAVSPDRLPRVVALTGATGSDYFARYVTDDEAQFIVTSAQQLPEDAVILGDPADGTAYYWAMGHRRVVFPHLGRPATPALREIALEAENVGSDPRVCALLRARGPDLYVYEDRSSTRAGGVDGPPSTNLYTGLDGIPTEHLTLVSASSDGEHRLYRLDLPC